MNDIFEHAVKNKIRFATNRGEITPEDLYDLPLERTNCNQVTSLDELAISLDKKLKESTTSFVSKKSNVNNILTLKFELVKHVIADKLLEKDENEKAAVKAQKKQTLLALISKKKDNELESKSIEDLESMLSEL